MTLDQNDPRIAASVAAYQRGDARAELNILAPILEEHPDDLSLLQRVGVLSAQLGDFAKGFHCLERALEVSPGDSQTITMLGWAHRRAGDNDAARKHFEDMIARHPQSPVAHVNFGDFLLGEGDNSGARASYESALAIDPNFVTALVNLASLGEREHKFDDAKPYAERAVAIDPDNGAANINLARIDLRQGRAREAADRMHNLMARAQLSDADIAAGFYVIGEAMDKLGEYDHAFYAFALANDTLFKQYGETIASTNSVLVPESLDKIQRFFENEDVSTWTPPVPNDGPTPVFLLGFARSGTTLLDQILSAHSAIETLEEKENFREIRNEIILPTYGLESMRTMTPDDINRYREMYWAHVREGNDVDLNGGLFIDKMPLNTMLLGLIYRIFPDAKIIFALRDPRDVILSCFQQRFSINVAMFHLTKTDMAASYYDRVMRIGETCRERLPLNVHVVRYEDVVNDMQKTVTDALSFLGLEWEDEIANYRDKARERWITTPSAEQVIEPLYQTSMGKWRNYQRQIAPVLPILEPWVEKFGYEPT